MSVCVFLCVHMCEPVRECVMHVCVFLGVPVGACECVCLCVYTHVHILLILRIVQEF